MTDGQLRRAIGEILDAKNRKQDVYGLLLSLCQQNAISELSRVSDYAFYDEDKLVILKSDVEDRLVILRERNAAS